MSVSTFSGVRINLDNLQEADRLAKLFDQHPELVISSDTATGTASSGSSGRGSAQRIIGIRINPQVGLRMWPQRWWSPAAAGKGCASCSKSTVLASSWRQPNTATEDRPFLPGLKLTAFSYAVQLVLDQVGEGRIAALSTAGRVSKFGVPLTEVRAQVVDAFVRHPWLNALHLHVGSQVGAGACA